MRIYGETQGLANLGTFWVGSIVTYRWQGVAQSQGRLRSWLVSVVSLL